MALTTCKDCKGPVSTSAKSCPRCGSPVTAAPIQKGRSILWLVIPLMSLGVILPAVVAYKQQAKQELAARNSAAAEAGLKQAMGEDQYRAYKEKQALDIEQAAERKRTHEKVMSDQSMSRHLAEAGVRSMLKDPDSARFGAQTYVVNKAARYRFTVCGYVSAKNSFGGYSGMQRYFSIDGAVVMDNGGDDFESDWQFNCR